MSDMQPNPKTTPVHWASIWLKHNRTRLQALALVLALGAPFGLYWALQSGHDGAAVACFAVTAVSLTAVIVVG